MTTSCPLNGVEFFSPAIGETHHWRRGAAEAGGCKTTSLTADPMLSPPIPSPSTEVPDPSAAPPCSRSSQAFSPQPQVPPHPTTGLKTQICQEHFRGANSCASSRPGQSSPGCPAILQDLHPNRPPSLEPIPPRSIWERGSRSLLQPCLTVTTQVQTRPLESENAAFRVLYSGNQKSGDLPNFIRTKEMVKRGQGSMFVVCFDST
jgi:hypothetical protein